MGRLACAFVLAVLAVGCQQQTVSEGLVIKDTGDEDVVPWWAGDNDRTNQPGDNGPSQAGPSAEVCDGIDNDLDGETDEGFVSFPCELGGDAGVTVCVNGREACHQCEPGETREAGCGCGITRHDRCNDVGRWLIGACSGCNEEAPVGCNSATACEPGTHRIERCDNCPPGVNCGTTCLGIAMTCSTNCQWIGPASCTPLEAECDRDHTRYEPCGKCGVRKVSCDGCYFDYGPCIDEGVCEPGDTFAASCGGQSCDAGLYANIRCTDKCEWEQGECAGCSLTAPPPIVTTACVPGADCGVRVTQDGCLAAGTAETCSGDQVVRGAIQSVVLRDDCIWLQCRAGETRDIACTTAEGRCGTQPNTCDNTCEWSAGVSGPCVARPDSCVPGTQSSEQVSCGPNTCGATFTRTSTCMANGCGVASQNGGGCPACAVGDSSEQGCTTHDGRCGTQSRVCTGSCDWGGWSACVARPDSCIPGTQSSTQIDCGSGLCGATITQTTTCAANGCGWITQNSGSCPACAAGQTQGGACTTATGACGTQSRSCSGSCEWGGWSSCQPSPQACDAGTTQPRACTWMCGLPGTQTATCNGCGWDLTGECIPLNSGACTPGDSEVIGPCATCPSQMQTRNCDTSCTWVNSTCRQCL